MSTETPAAETQGSASTESEQSKPVSFELVGNIVKLLESLSSEEQTHVLQTVLTWLHLDHFSSRAQPPQEVRSRPLSEKSGSSEYPFSGRAEVTPKEFMLEKEPKTDLERLTCLAYYLTHYRNQPHFKTEDLSKLNMEAAQQRFSNAAFTGKNAMTAGFFVQAPKKGLRQLSAFGEQYVQALPDHDAAREVRKKMGSRVRRPRGNTDRSTEIAEQSKPA